MTSSIDRFREFLRTHHEGNTQRQYLALAALDALKGALESLAALGHRFDIVEAEPAPPDEFPKMMFHAQHGNLVVHSKEAVENLSPGWQDKPIGWFDPKGRDQEVAEAPPPHPVPVDISAAMARGQIDHRVEEPLPEVDSPDVLEGKADETGEIPTPKV